MKSACRYKLSGSLLLLPAILCSVWKLLYNDIRNIGGLSQESRNLFVGLTYPGKVQDKLGRGDLVFCVKQVRVKEGFDCVSYAVTPCGHFLTVTVSYDMEKFIELGKTFQLEGAELLTFVEKHQELKREEKCRREDEENEERLRIAAEDKEVRCRQQ